MRILKICAIFVMGSMIGCGSSEPEKGTPLKEQMARPEPVTPQPRPFRIIGNQIIVDVFDVRYDLRDTRMTIALDTDLGDAAAIMVSVSRSYWERGSKEEYPLDYFGEKSTVGAWRQPRIIRVDHQAWKKKLEERQKVLASVGEPFTVSRIADDIEISFVVPVNQEPPFERLNANLTGKVVTQDGNLRVVQQEILVNYPIDAKDVGQTRFADPLALSPETTYRVSREIPLSPEMDPVDPMAAIASIRKLSPGEEFMVLETKKRYNTPWYRVRTQLGEGWINSTALLGQEIVVVR